MQRNLMFALMWPPLWRMVYIGLPWLTHSSRDLLEENEQTSRKCASKSERAAWSDSRCQGWNPRDVDKYATSLPHSLPTSFLFLEWEQKITEFQKGSEDFSGQLSPIFLLHKHSQEFKKWFFEHLLDTFCDRKLIICKKALSPFQEYELFGK